MTLSIEVRDLTQRYGDFAALESISFHLNGPGITGLLGRNGSGKTTLLSVLAGLRAPSSGDVWVGGMPVFEQVEATSQICLIRESGDTVDGSERVHRALAFAETMRPYWDGIYAQELLNRFEVSPDEKIGQLSRGQRAALACTLGLASRAPVTMFDEAYLGLDAPSRYLFYDELLRDYMEYPRTVIISTHLIEEVSNLLEDVLLIDHGRLLLHEDADSLRTRGTTVVGPTAAAERFTAPYIVLNRRSLGPTSSIVVAGVLTSEDRARARAVGLELEPVPLQDLFVHLTSQPSRGSARELLEAATS